MCNCRADCTAEKLVLTVEEGESPRAHFWRRGPDGRRELPVAHNHFLWNLHWQFGIYHWEHSRMEFFGFLRNLGNSRILFWRCNRGPPHHFLGNLQWLFGIYNWNNSIMEFLGILGILGNFRARFWCCRPYGQLLATPFQLELPFLILPFSQCVIRRSTVEKSPLFRPWARWLPTPFPMEFALDQTCENIEYKSWIHHKDIHWSAISNIESI